MDHMSDDPRSSRPPPRFNLSAALATAGITMEAVPPGGYSLGGSADDQSTAIAAPVISAPVPRVTPRGEWTCPGSRISRSPVTLGQWLRLAQDPQLSRRLEGLLSAEDLARSEARRVTEPEVLIPPTHGSLQASSVRPPHRAFIQQLEPDPPLVVSLQTARAVAAALGMELPSWQVWEAAARGADGRAYPWGDRLDRADLVIEHQNYSIDEESTMGYYFYDQDVYFVRSFGPHVRCVSPCGLTGLAHPGWEWNRSAPGELRCGEDHLLRSISDLGTMAYMVPGLRPGTMAEDDWRRYAHRAFSGPTLACYSTPALLMQSAGGVGELFSFASFRLAARDRRGDDAVSEAADLGEHPHPPAGTSDPA